MSAPAFSRRATQILVGVTTLSFLAALALSVFGPELMPVESHEADAYSYSSVGHGALVDTLRELDIPVFVSSWQSGRRAGKRGVLVLIEPRVGRHFEPITDEDFLAEITQAEACLLVLPKWRVRESRGKAGWAEDATPRLEAEVLESLDAVEVPAEIARVEVTSTWRMNEFGEPPVLAHPQLLRSQTLDPLIACDEGMLAGETMFDGTRLIVVSDPDLLSNVGMREGANAVLAVRLIEHLRRDGAVVVDETLHGYYFEPSIWRELFTFPLSLIVAHVVLWLVVLLWAAMGRFGSPKREAPPLEPGNRFLIRNTADLLRFGGHKGHVVERYLADSVRQVAETLHAPRDARSGKPLQDWIAHIEEARGVGTPLSSFAHPSQVAQAGEERAVAIAVQIHEWKQEILDESRSGP